jgi:hypothetical protein
MYGTYASCAALQSAGYTASGEYGLRPCTSAHADSVVVPAYCDMSVTPAGQSLFTTNGSPMAFEGSVVCTLTYSNDDMDSTMMWVDYTGKVDRTNYQNPTSST